MMASARRRAVLGTFAMLLLLLAPAVAFAESPPTDWFRFRRHVIHAESQYSAAAVGDFDQDGLREIVCGDFRYEGPEFRPERFRDVQQIRGRFDDYSNLPLDVDGDGWVDLVSVNYRSESLAWIRNPGPSRAIWERALIERPGPSETGRLVDIDGDNRLDVLPNGVNFAAWYQVQRGGVESSGGANWRWVRHELPPQLAGHGLGAGDIDDDGMVDIVAATGWARQQRDSSEQRWEWRPEFRLHRDASIAILVFDVDHDSDTDIVWGRGHDVGLYWLEQQSNDGRRTWIQHTIDSAVSQVHAPLMGDLDGDGHPELIAGRRFLGHDGKDAGEYDPLRIVVYRWNADSRTWISYDVSRDGNWGMDLDPKCDDVDGDGDLDLVAPARSGLAWFENLRIEIAAEGVSPAVSKSTVTGEDVGRWSVVDAASGVMDTDHYRHDSLLELQRVPGQLQRITDLRDWGRRRWHIQLSMQQVMGNLPGPVDRVPLDVRVHDTVESPRWVRQRISYQSDPQHRVPAYLYLPHDRSAEGRAMLCLHPTSSHGKDIISGVGSDPGGAYALELAERGFVVIAPDYPTFGEYKVALGGPDDPYVSGSMRAIWDNHRAVDLLESLPQVDPNRIGCMGHSLGGHNSLFTAAFDQRLRTVVTSCGFTAFADYYGGNLKGWASDRYMPRIRDVYGSNPSRMPFDFPELLGLIAPRPLWISAPQGDSNFEVRGVKKCVESVRPVYQLYGNSEALQVRYPEAEHSFPVPSRREVYDWLMQIL